MDKRFLEKNHGCPYIVGVDIFVIDNIPNEQAERELFVSMFSYAYSAGMRIDQDTDYKNCPEELKELVKETERLTGITLDKNQPLKGQLIALAEKISAMYFDEDVQDVAMVGYLVHDMNLVLKKAWFKDIVYLQFENIRVPAPKEYEKVLRVCFGDDYMIPKQVYVDHEYPYYKDQEQFLFEKYRDMGLSIPDSFLN